MNLGQYLGELLLRTDASLIVSGAMPRPPACSNSSERPARLGVDSLNVLDFVSRRRTGVRTADVARQMAWSSETASVRLTNLLKLGYLEREGKRNAYVYTLAPAGRAALTA